MIHELKQLAGEMKALCDAADTAAGRIRTTYGLLRLDLCLFLAHLSKSDFELSEEETQFIADHLEVPLTTAELNALISRNRTDSPNFAKAIPTSYKRLAQYDTAAHPTPTACSRYISFFRQFGTALISVDGHLLPDEQESITAYLSALETYASPTA